MAFRISPERTSKGSQQQSLHWRSTGWTPLAYPASSLVVLAEESVSGIGTTVKVEEDKLPNPYFPLNEQVLLAATRELLILDGTLDSETLGVSKEQASYRDLRQKDRSTVIGPCFLRHMYQDRFRRLPILSSKWKSSKADRKRKLTDHSPIRKKRKTCSAPSLRAASQKIRVKDVTGEVLSQTIIRRSLICRDESQSRPQSPDSVRLRKVSDADVVDSSRQLELIEEPLNEPELSLFLDLGRKGPLCFRRKEIPSMLSISIVTEETLRNRAFDMIARMTRSFEDETLRHFLGYKACSMKRERLLRLLGDHLFDVSHAMFAWKQTESEMLAERHGQIQRKDCPGDLSDLIRDSLFDERALKRIGGFDDSSLLPQALAIDASKRKEETWEAFATTKRGLEMLRHHKEGKACLVGQKRRVLSRGQRIKSRLPPVMVLPFTDEQGRRSRSSSISTMDDDQSLRSAESSSSDVTEIAYADKSEVLQLTLKRQPGKPWGFLLAREGNLCLVDRATTTTSDSLRRGDMVLSARNERGESFQPPSSLHVAHNRTTDANSDLLDWFREIVGLFKMSNELHLMVRRV